MAIESLNSAADFAHLDGALVYPMQIDDYHVLIVEDGATLLLPAGMHVRFPGRFGIDTDGTPFVDTRVDGEDAHKLALWGQGLRQSDMVEVVRSYVTTALAQSPNPEQYINRPPGLREEI